MKQPMWFVRNKQNPSLALATNGEWEPMMLLGPGRRLGVKLYKTEAGAARAKNGRGTPEQLMESQPLTLRSTP